MGTLGHLKTKLKGNRSKLLEPLHLHSTMTADTKRGREGALASAFVPKALSYPPFLPSSKHVATSPAQSKKTKLLYATERLGGDHHALRLGGGDRRCWPKAQLRRSGTLHGCRLPSSRACPSCIEGPSSS